MTRLFFRLFIAVVLTLILTSWALDFIFEHYVEQPVDKNKQRLEKSLRMLAQGYVENAGSNLEKNIEELRHRFDAPVSIDPTSQWALPEEDFARLQAGEVIDLEDEQGRILLLGLKSPADKILSLGPFPRESNFHTIEYALMGVFFLILGGALLLWVWPHWRNLEKLSAASQSFGQGNLDARAKLSDKSAISDLAHTFNSMAERIQGLIQSHKHLTSSVAHELRTPLSRISFSLEMLQSAEGKNLFRHLSSMQQDVSELENLITEMMTYARLERGTPPLQLQKLKIIPLLSQLIERFKPDGLNKTLAIRYDEKYEHIKVNCYESYLERAVINLISNALRYANEQIVMEFTCEDDHCVIHVDDDGPGIPKNKRKEALLPFSRLDSNKQGGKNLNFGLGLSIVDQIAKWHEGYIKIEDSPLGGSRFSLSWPCQAEHPPVPTEQPVEKENKSSVA